MTSPNAEFIQECKRQSENCLYTSTSLFIWVRFLRWIRIGFIVAPLLLGALAGWKILTVSEASAPRTLAAAFGFLAGVIPTIYAALKLDDRIGDTKYLAAEFKNLQDRFRQTALITALKAATELECEFKVLMDRLERARSVSVTPPEWCFRKARKKIKEGHYEWDVDG